MWDSRSDFWIFAQVAARLGWGEECTEGRNEEEWAKRFWQFSDLPKHISWEDFKKKGYYIPPVSYKEEYKDPDVYKRHFLYPLQLDMYLWQMVE